MTVSKIIDFLERVKPALLTFIKKQSVKAILKKLAISGGIKGWLIGFVIGELIEEADERILEPILLKLGYKSEVKKGERIYKKVINVENRDDWRDASRDV